MKKNIIKKALVMLAIITIIVISSGNINAITPDQITGSETEIEELKFIDNVTDLVRTVGSFIAVGALMVIGIRYMMGSTEERASYKKSMMPYIIGAVLLFAAVNITTIIYNVSTEASASKASTTQTHIQKPGGSNKSGGVIVLPQ